MESNESVTPPADKRSEQELVDVDHVGTVPLSIARQIYQSIARHFGGRQNLTEAQRKKRAEDAANARWGNKEKL